MSTCRFHFSSRYDQRVLQKGQPVATATHTQYHSSFGV